MSARHPALVALSHDHHRGLVIAHRLREGLPLDPQSPKNDLPTRIGFLREFFFSHLRPHFLAEEEILFPLILPAITSLQPLIEKLLREHRALESLIKDLEHPDTRDANKMLQEFGSVLEGHIRAEERELFSVIEQEAPEELLTTLTERMQAYEHRQKI